MKLTFLFRFSLSLILLIMSLTPYASYALTQPEKPVVALFSATWCPSCKKAVAYLEELGVDYTLYDIDTPEGQELYAPLNAAGVPIFTIGTTRIDGLNVTQLNATLCQHGILEKTLPLCS